jgi:hypothetical protein
MSTKNKTQIMGAYAPQKRPLFSTTMVEKGARVEYINNAPQEEIRNTSSQEMRRRRIRAD